MAYNKPTANQISLGSTTNLDQVINPSGVWIGSPTNLQGATGSQGATGAQGFNGTLGTQGTTGTQGATGSQGATGAQGTNGSNGTQGTTGIQGPGGLTTTDATTLDSLDSTDFTRRYASSNTGMTAGWYTIAVNGGNRAVGRFVLTDDSSGAHQSVIFDATHHYGNGNGITVHHQGAYSTTYFRYLRIMSGLTYDGAMLQVYIDGTTSGTLKVAIDGNEQNQGWTVKGFIIGSSNPGTVFAYANLTSTTANTDLDLGGSGANQILVSGNIFAGSATTQYQVIHKGCTADSLQLGSLGIGTAASGTAGEIRATNNITAYYSDMRLKNKLYNIDNPLWKVMRLSGFYFEPNEIAQAFGYELKREVGVSAQEVEAVMPEAVAPAPISDKYLTVRYEKLVPLLIEAIKELKREVDELKERL